MFQSIPSFTPLLRHIYEEEGLPFATPERLTPGTNAVFKVGSTVVKVFFPKESGLDPIGDYTNETRVCNRLLQLSISTPRLLAHGSVEDKYRFYYIVFDYFQGKEAGAYLKNASYEEKKVFASRLKNLLHKLNTPAPGLISSKDLLEQAINNPRLTHIPASLAQELKAGASSLTLTPQVLVHGDLTGENLLVDKDGRLVMIDCADACLAPEWYELGPIVFELFRCDPTLLKLFAGEDRKSFIEQAIASLCIHDFGAGILSQTALREGLPPFTSLSQVRKLLEERLK